jgi:hypothetical protein
MRSLRWFVVAAVSGAALISSEVAAGVGPWPALARAVVAPGGHVRYTASFSGHSTIVRAARISARGGVLRAARFDGAWGIPAITSTGVAGGLSPDGRVLVLSEPSTSSGLRSQSRFLVLSASTLARRGTIVLRGEFGFDVLSPDGRTLYVIQHTSRSDLVAYVVRAYDLRQKRLLPGAIVAKGESETMRGYPVSRATSSGGSWVYTLYQRGSGKPFVHALNAAGRYAICIDLPWHGSLDGVWQARLALSHDGRHLLVRSGGKVVATVDTKSFRVT